MIKKLTKFGNSMALIIDRPILQLLHIDENTELELKIVGDSLLITPVKTGKKRIVSKDKKTQEAYEKMMEEYSDAFKKLAE